MKITDLPKKSQAAIRLRQLDVSRRKERLRCAGEVFDVGRFSHEQYKDEPAQWIRCEQILRAILQDNLLTMECLVAIRAESRARKVAK